MLDFLKKEANKTTTENNAATYQSTLSSCLDLFATIGALRSEPKEEIIARFNRAWAEERTIALKILFFARDIREGLGEREVFRTILSAMASDRIGSVTKNLWAIPEFGRFDDFLRLLDTPAKGKVLIYVKELFEADISALQKGEDVSLLGKWLPSVNAQNTDTVRYGKTIAKAFGLSEAQYRKSLTKLRAKIAIIENNLRERDYSFDYSKQPSKAMLKYRKAFLRNDGERYKNFLSKVERGEVKLNTGTLMPYEIISPAFGGFSISKITEDERRSMDVTWKAQENFTNGENALVVVDGSGSMYASLIPMPAAVALSLGIYFAERNTGAFKNHFITFSENPRLVEIKGSDIYDKVKYASSFNEVANTNIQKVFELILKTAVKNKLSHKELPTKIYIISDMEFDYCTKDADITNFDYAKDIFTQHGYKLPDVVFWNVASRNTQQPVTLNEKGVVLVSGANARVFSMISSGSLSPYAFMMQTLGTQRYARIEA
ncbi:MAG: DUF2828 family protein [Clostridiales bacterium]|jgi:hypothetical protein|nr:DUF2828 family protein [Clostridiales bacterium]